MQNSKISQFYDLNVWREGHKLVLSVYRFIKDFPDKEKFVLVSQMLRAALSITSNIAEGFGRQGEKEKIQFYSISKGSLTELQNQLLICRDLQYLTHENFNSVWEQSVVVHKMLNALIKSIRNK